MRTEYNLEKGALVVKSPEFVPDKEIINHLNDNKEAIINIVEVKKEKKRKTKTFEFEDGEKFDFIGEKKELRVVEDEGLDGVKISLEDDEIIAEVSPNLEEEERKKLIKNNLKEWYREKAREVFQEKIQEYFYLIDEHSDFDFEYEDLKLRVNDNKRTMGSVNTGIPSINLTWHLVTLPEELIDTGIVHELGHFSVPAKRQNMHSKKYYKFCEEIIPNFKDNHEKIDWETYWENF